MAADVPSTWVDDALLHDVRWIGSRIAFAVGEHGAIWKSTDGAQSWLPAHYHGDVSLRSVWFVDDQTGWIAGRTSQGYSGGDASVLISTRDGGKTWQPVTKETLPPLSYVRFFGLDDGVVVGQPTARGPAGIFKTTDGGLSWYGVQGEAAHEWKAMCFLESEMGVVGGVHGRVSIMGGQQLYASKLQPQGFRSVRSIGLSASEAGWLAGDGGLVLKTSTDGVVWESPEEPLPEDLRNCIDFRAVEVRNNHVWLAGSPGSSVWRSTDGGRQWKMFTTGQTTPISALRFANERQGIAVGAMGVILRTDDGGETWTSVRGGGRRAAILSLHARPGRTSPALLTKLAGEQGFRSTVWIAQRDDIGPLAWASESESILQTAVQNCGGHAADIHWQLPILRPAIEFSSEKLVEEWQKQTEGRLPQTLMGAIVRQIRTWRPNILILDQPSPDDAAARLLFDATLRAVDHAADASRFLEQTELTGLEAWHVDRIYMRLAPGGTGDTHIELDEYLPRLRQSTRTASSSSMTLLQAGRVPVSDGNEGSRIAYRWIDETGEPAENSGATGSQRSAMVSREFLGGLSIAPGSAARRELEPLDETDLERMQKIAQKARNFHGVFQKSLDDPRIAGQMIAQINGIVDGMEPEQGVNLLRNLADEYRARSQFELVESTYVELIRRYPQEPGTLDPMKWLIQFWSSSETAWQRTQAMKSGTVMTQSNSRQGSLIQQAGFQVDDGTVQGAAAGLQANREDSISRGNSASPVKLNVKLDLEATHSRDLKATKAGRLKIARDVDWRTGAVADWHSRSAALAKQLQITSPTLFQSPEIQFPLAAMRRTSGSIQSADSIMRNFVTQSLNAEMKALAERELWASFTTPETPNSLVHCYATAERPYLDGLLSDSCWIAAKEIHLYESPPSGVAGESGTGDRPSMAMFSYDTEYFYLAVRVPREKSAPPDRPQTTGRQHDADLSRHDRISVRLDIDRDYMTWYEFQIDQRGWTAESCWEDRRWNPTWYVAAEMDSTDWRIEAAIPWKDLSPSPPQHSTIYGISVMRTIPGVGLQSWTHPATARPQPSSFGLIKFE